MKRIISIIALVISVNLNAQQVTYKWASAPSGLRMRQTPDLNGVKLQTIPNGDRVVVLEVLDKMEYLSNTSGKWTKVKWGSETGWVYGAYLSDCRVNSLAEEKIHGYYMVQALHESVMNKPLSLCRIELDGHGFRVLENGTVSIIDDTEEMFNDFDFNHDFYFENGIYVSLNQGYEWGSTNYQFARKNFTLQQVFGLAADLFGEKYMEYMTVRDGRPVLPTIARSVTKENDESYSQYEVVVENGKLVSFRIDEGMGCGEWWYFNIDEDSFSFGSGGGC